MEILPRPEEIVPPLKWHHLVKMSAASSLVEAPPEEPTFRITEFVEPYSSDVVSSDPSVGDHRVSPALGSMAHPRGGEDES